MDNNSVIWAIGVHFAKYNTTTPVWDYLDKFYTWSNFSRQFDSETDIHSLKENNMRIQEFYVCMYVCLIYGINHL